MDRLDELKKELSSKKLSLALFKNRIKYHNEKDYSIPELKRMCDDLENQISELVEFIQQYNI